MSEKICKNKAGFRSAAMAHKQLQRIQESSNRDRKPNRVYHCNICGKWHLTSTDFNYKQSSKEPTAFDVQKRLEYLKSIDRRKWKK